VTDFEGSRARLILITVIDEPGEVLRSSAQDPVLLERLALTVLLGHVQVAHAERSQ
jgi:hypothetical protein